MKIECSEVPKQTFPPYFDQLSERHQPLCGDVSYAMMLENKNDLDNDRYEGEDMMVVASFKGGKRNM